MDKDVDPLDNSIGRIKVLNGKEGERESDSIRKLRGGEKRVRWEKQVYIAVSSAVNMEAEFLIRKDVMILSWIEIAYPVRDPDLDPSVKQRR